MPRPSHPPWLDNSNYTWRKFQVMKLLIMQFSPASYHFIPLRSKYSLQHMFSNTISLYSSLNIRDQISHPYRTTDKIIVFHILIFMFLDSGREDKVLDWMVANITRNQSPFNFLLN
jgi:hypothetical protein